MSKNIFDEAKTNLEDICIDFDEHGYAPTIPTFNRDVNLHFYTIYKKEVDEIDEALKLGKLYKEFFDALKPNVIKYVVDDYETPEYLDFEAEDTTKCLEIFKKIKELENDK